MGTIVVSTGSSVGQLRQLDLPDISFSRHILQQLLLRVGCRGWGGDFHSFFGAKGEGRRGVIVLPAESRERERELLLLLLLLRERGGRRGFVFSDRVVSRGEYTLAVELESREREKKLIY
jgi:hypothetical protein